MSATSTQSEPPTPTFPSLYDPLLEFHNLEHHDAIQPGGKYLRHGGGRHTQAILHCETNASAPRTDVFRFTFYWTLIFHSLFFLVTGGIACFNIIYPPRREKQGAASPSLAHKHAPPPMIPLTPLAGARPSDASASELSDAAEAAPARAPQPQKNVHRSRVTYALLTLFTFMVTALGAAFVESTVVGYILWAVCRTGHFNISTWLPAVWALIITSSVVLGAFPSVIDRI
ncbi:hypothetical protein BC834DRAFT_840736 [Gloeopeniophorella convolvens]|nr:hypothetical protein BC834DRAFT_840736 [Gloeopeniophorella convolvens]